MALLSEQQKHQISDAIARVEKRTSGELVVVIVPRSRDYAYFRAVPALAATIGIAWAAYSALPTVHSAWVFASQGVLWPAFFALFGWAPLLRRFVPSEVQARAVDGRIKQLFIERGLTETRDRSAVLILISEAEHRVQILADRGIHVCLPADHWNGEVRSIVQAIRRGEAAAGLSGAINSIGAKLAEHFPPLANNANELPDRVIDLS
jgi:putative membrane protein